MEITYHNFSDFETKHPDLTSAVDHRSPQLIIKSGGKVRHFDLAKMSEKALHEQREYTMQCCNAAVERIRKKASQLDINGLFNYIVETPVSKIPFWKLLEDLSIHTDRMEAICEEIKYRRIP